MYMTETNKTGEADEEILDHVESTYLDNKPHPDPLTPAAPPVTNAPVMYISLIRSTHDSNPKEDVLRFV